MVKLSIDAMLECIGPDLWEEALLRPMDFGHSFSRTLEADERFKLRHGEAVAIDCIMNALIAEQKGVLSAEQVLGHSADIYVYTDEFTLATPQPNPHPRPLTLALTPL